MARFSRDLTTIQQDTVQFFYCKKGDIFAIIEFYLYSVFSKHREDDLIGVSPSFWPLLRPFFCLTFLTRRSSYASQ